MKIFGVEFDFESDTTRHKRHMQTVIAVAEANKLAFIKEAVASGFTHQQATLMAKYMSFEGHQHAILSNNSNWMSTRRLEDYV